MQNESVKYATTVYIFICTFATANLTYMRFRQQKTTKYMKATLITAMLIGGMLAACTQKTTNEKGNSDMEQKLELTQEWDKVFPKSDKVNH